MAKHNDTIPIEVCILTVDHDIKGTVHVSKYTNTNRELTDLLNDKERRFLAVTNVEIYPRNSNQPPRRYNFLLFGNSHGLCFDGSPVISGCVQRIFQSTGRHCKI